METASLLFLRKKFNEFDVHDELVSDVITAFEKASDMFINVVIKQRKNVNYEKIAQDREADISEAIKQAIIMFEDRGHGNADKDGRYAFALEQLSRFFSASNMELEKCISRLYGSPSFLVPTQISKRLHNQESAKLYGLLDQALHAFVFGSPAGAIALMRSIVENVLAEHYQSNGGDLCELINQAKGLPQSASSKDLHKLRRVANSVLHTSDTDCALNVNHPIQLDGDKDVITLLQIVKNLIEGAPRFRVA